ncbi:MAG TPA: cytochrome c [Candidatus Acidoferrales bacterium]|nr:cytochrome c [Candidatus Acidoferrales bacterium]
MTRARLLDGSRWGLAAAPAALAFLARIAFGEDASLVDQGKRVFNDQGCYGCHTMGKSGTPIAPDLSTIGSKHSEAYLRTWLEDPKLQKPRAHMPKLQLSEDEVRALAAYLASLK